MLGVMQVLQAKSLTARRDAKLPLSRPQEKHFSANLQWRTTRRHARRRLVCCNGGEGVGDGDEVEQNF